MFKLVRKIRRLWAIHPRQGNPNQVFTKLAVEFAELSLAHNGQGKDSVPDEIADVVRWAILLGLEHGYDGEFLVETIQSKLDRALEKHRTR